MKLTAELLAATGAAGDDVADQPTVIGPYRVIDLLGTGGMGRVYRCYDSQLKRIVAVKLLAPRIAEIPSCVDRFEREACVIASLVHPNVVQAYGIGRFERSLYLAMEYVDGTCAERLIDKYHGLHPTEALRVASEAAAGLAAAHQIGVVHCDVKPSNILVTKERAVKIVDFGLAKPVASEGRLLDGGLTAGSPAYISPEAACGRPTDHRSDMYSLGIATFEMLTGERPFRAEHMGDLLRKQVRQPLPELASILPNLAAEVTQVIEGLTAKLPEDRYQTWDEASRAIASAIAGCRAGSI